MRLIYSYKVSEYLKEKDHLGDLILEWILEKQILRLWIGFICLEGKGFLKNVISLRDPYNEENVFTGLANILSRKNLHHGFS
jgi:hypothetical protein